MIDKELQDFARDVSVGSGKVLSRDWRGGMAKGNRGGNEKNLSESYSMNSRSFFSVLVVSSKISIDNKSFNNISKDLEGRQRYSRVSFHV